MAKKRSRVTDTYFQWSPQNKTLITLDDQSYQTTVNTSLFGFGGRDQSWNPHAESFLNFNSSQFHALDITPKFIASDTEIQLRLKAGGNIGAAPLRAPDTGRVIGGIVVRPRYGWDGVGSVLNSIGWAASPQILATPMVPGSAREVPAWVFAAPILGRLRRLLREMKRGYRDIEELRQMPRGRILWQKYVTNQMAHGAWHELPCRFPELDFDQTLRAYIRWGIESVNRAISPFVYSDPTSRSLYSDGQELLQQVMDVPALCPDKRTFTQMLQGLGLPSILLMQGLEALGWLVDDRGLGGLSNLDGLAWTMSMSDLFEKWVALLAVLWAKTVGGEVKVGYRNQTVVPMVWEHRVFESLNSLVPDIVVQSGNSTYIFDAKYKGHLDDIDERQWIEANEDIRADHRHDVHQVLAYSSLYGTENVTAVLVYPIRSASWQRLVQTNNVFMKTQMVQYDRNVQLILTGIPLQAPDGGFGLDVLDLWKANL